MSYTFDAATSMFFGDVGAGNEKPEPYFILAHAYVPIASNFDTVKHIAAFSTSADTAVSGEYASAYFRGTLSPDARIGGILVGSTTRHVSNTVTASTYTGVWFPFGAEFVSPTSRRGYVTSTAPSVGDSTSNTVGSLRSLRIGGLTDSGFFAGIRVAEVVYGFFDPSNEELDAYFGGTSALDAFSGKSFWYYPLATEATSHADASPNGGPTVSATGAVNWLADHPTITGGVRYIPSVQPLYYGANPLANKTGISYKVTTGHTNLLGDLLAAGTDGTTDASGNFVLPAEVSFSTEFVIAANDPITLHMYWEEGSDPVVDRSLIVKTTAVAEA